MNEIDIALAKVKAATTLCHLCILDELNDFVKQIKGKKNGRKNKSRCVVKA